MNLGKHTSSVYLGVLVVRIAGQPPSPYWRRGKINDLDQVELCRIVSD